MRSHIGNYFGKSRKEAILPVLDALSILSAVPWRVNNGVLPLVMRVFQDGGDPRLMIPISLDKVTLPDVDMVTLSGVR